MNFYTQSCNVLLFELSSQVSLDERGLKMMSVHAGRARLKPEKVKRILLVARAIAVILFEGCGLTHLSCSTITNKHKLEAGGTLGGSLRHFLERFRMVFAIKVGRAVPKRPI